jgi:hypothetical protein
MLMSKRVPPGSRRYSLLLATSLASLAALGCSDTGDPTGSGGEGSVSFTTWGEAYIEDEIPADLAGENGFIDGWSVKYEHFLVNFANIVVADQKGAVAVRMPGMKLFDNHVPSVKSIVDFDAIPAKAYTEVSYEIVPPAPHGDVGPDVDEELRQKMIDEGYSVYVDATATRDGEALHYAWGFPIATRYENCHSEQGGRDEKGFVIRNNATIEVQLTTHGDHLYYDRLQSSPNPSVRTALRFDAIALADADGDGELQLDELDGVSMAKLVGTYDLSGFKAATLKDFVTHLARTVGHFRGEGECDVTGL